MPSEKREFETGEAPGELEAQIMIGEGLAQSLTLAARNLRSTARYWYMVASGALLSAFGVGWLLAARPRSEAWQVLASDPGQTLLATLFTGLLCMAFYCLARSIVLRHLACEADMLSQSNFEAVAHGYTALQGPS